VSKLVLRAPRDYDSGQFQDILTQISQQANLHAEGKLVARHGAMTAAPTAGNWALGDFVWNSNPSKSSEEIILGWLCTVSGTPGTFEEVRVRASTLIATQAQQETGTSTTVFVSPGRQQFHASACKAWVLFNGTGTLAVTGSYNVTSVTDNAAGDYTVNFTTAFSGATYAMAGSVGQAGAGTPLGVVGHNQDNIVFSGSAVRIYTLRSTDATAVDYPKVSVAFFGDQ
jgi:hypothetical protein